MPSGKSKRIIIDTNLWISFLISKRLDILEKIIFQDNVILLFSNELIDEIKVSIEKPKLKKHFSLVSLSDMLESIEEFSELIHVKSKVTVCRDSKDNFLLSLAKDGKANYILTGDKDLLVLRKFGKIQIVTLSDYFSKRGTNG